MPALMHKFLANAQQHLWHMDEKHPSSLNVSLKFYYVLENVKNVNVIFFSLSLFCFQVSKIKKKKVSVGSILKHLWPGR